MCESECVTIILLCSAFILMSPNTLHTLGRFKEAMRNTNKIPRTVDQFEQVTEVSTEGALKVIIVSL